MHIAGIHMALDIGFAVFFLQKTEIHAQILNTEIFLRGAEVLAIRNVFLDY